MEVSKQRQSEFVSVDAVVIGAGFSGLYMLYRLREAGLSTRVYEAGEGVGGVWHWNRYPGARCDSESICYNYTFSEELYKEWSWSSRFPEQHEILNYLNFVADKFKLRSGIQFNTRVNSASYDEESKRWLVQTDQGDHISAKYLITGVGCLSTANMPNIVGLENFKGEWYHTGHWPHEKVDFTGKRVGVVGTGSSGIQSIPVIAKEAKHLTVFQRTPQFSVPAKNHKYTEEFVQKSKDNYERMRNIMRNSTGGMDIYNGERSVLEDTPEQRQKVLEAAWEKGGWSILMAYNDILVNEKGNKLVAEFVRSKIREIVKDPETAEKLVPDHYYGTKRAIIDTNYFETYNRDNVRLVDVKQAPIEEITSTGIRTADSDYELDTIVFATGFDGMTGSLFKIDITGRNGVTLKEKWANGEKTQTYLGLTTVGFPNLFMLTGPESPSVLGNMPAAIEQHVEWVMDCIDHLHKNDVEVFEAMPEAEEKWSQHCRELADATLYTKTESWYTGANIDTKARGFQIYVGGYNGYRKICDEVAAKGYEGFSLVSSKRQLH